MDETRHLHHLALHLLQAGTITVTTGSGQPLTLAPGTTWSPHHILRGASRRAILIHLDVREIRQILAGQ